MQDVAIVTGAGRYCDTPPFHPGEAYPELPFREHGAGPNEPYAAVRRLLSGLGLDAARAGTPDWNPLGALIRPGDTVVLKPNFVLDQNASGDDIFAVVTHPSLLRALVDYAYLALRGKGRILIADAPQMDCSWEHLMQVQRLDSVQDFYRQRFGFNVEVLDLREFELVDARQPAYAGNRRARPGDPAGSVTINLGRQSALHELDSAKFYGADYNRQETIARHHGDRQEYVVSGTILSADVVICVPKLKVHKKVGVTLNLKGLVGINTNKNCLVHYRVGPPSRGGDQLPDGVHSFDSRIIRIQRWLFDRTLARQNRLGDALYRGAVSLYRACIKPFRHVSRETMTQDAGNWHGNDSAWRMTADLARIFHFADASGKLHDQPQRRMFSVIDGIVGGDREGPLAPRAVPAGCLAGGANLIAVDLAATRLMGLDPARIKQFSVLRDPRIDFGFRRQDEITVILNGKPETDFFQPGWTSPVPAFEPHPGWTGQIEVQP